MSKTGGVPPKENMMPRSRRSFGTIQTRARKPGYYVLFVWEGKRYRRAAGPDRRVAERNLARVQALLSDGKPIGDVLSEVFGELGGARMTLRDAVPRHLEYSRARKKPSTWKSDVDRVRALRDASWASKVLAYVTPEDLSHWCDDRLKGGTSGATVNRYYALGSALYRWADRFGDAEDNPSRDVERFRESKGKEVHLTAEESRALVGVAPSALRPLLLCALSTRMRRGELLALAWRHVNFTRQEIHVRAESEKAGRGRAVSMTEDLARELWIPRN